MLFWRKNEIAFVGTSTFPRLLNRYTFDPPGMNFPFLNVLDGPGDFDTLFFGNLWENSHDFIPPKLKKPNPFACSKQVPGLVVHCNRFIFPKIIASLGTKR